MRAEQPDRRDDPGSVARLVWRTVPYALVRAGVTQSGDVAFELAGPGGEIWTFGDPTAADTVVRGDAAELCEVAGQRVTASATGLGATGPDAMAVLSLMRTFA